MRPFSCQLSNLFPFILILSLIDLAWNFLTLRFKKIDIGYGP